MSSANGPENKSGREIWNGIELPLLLPGQEQLDIDRIIFTYPDFLSLRKYVKNFGLRDTYDAMVREGWEKDYAVAVLRTITTQIPESPLK